MEQEENGEKQKNKTKQKEKEMKGMGRLSLLVEEGNLEKIVEKNKKWKK